MVLSLVLKTFELLITQCLDIDTKNLIWEKQLSFNHMLQVRAISFTLGITTYFTCALHLLMGQIN